MPKVQAHPGAVAGLPALLNAEWVASLSDAHRAMLGAAITPRLTRYIPHTPTPKQVAFLLLPHREALYGGAAGGGKSDALLMAALQYVDVPGYSALLLRRTFRQLNLAESLIPRAALWLAGTDARWHGGDMRWTFPSGATLEFGHVQHEVDKLNYQSAAYQFIGFDELTQFTLSQYTYLTSRLRRLAGSPLPLRVRSGSNPGGVSHEAMRSRFPITPESEAHPERAFIPAKLGDNPYLDRDEYERTLMDLDPVTRAQLLNGDWSARRPGGYFKREDFHLIDAVPQGVQLHRYWDLAATEDDGSNDPDWTAGCLGGCHEGRFIVADVDRFRGEPGTVEKRIRHTAEMDGKGVGITIEQEPGASGKIAIDHYRRNVLVGYTVTKDRPTGDKTVRARPLSSASDAGNVLLVRGAWVPAFLNEAEAFGTGGHDDIIDSMSGCFAEVMVAPGMSMSDVLALMARKPDDNGDGNGDAEIDAEAQASKLWNLPEVWGGDG